MAEKKQTVAVAAKLIDIGLCLVTSFVTGVRPKREQDMHCPAKSTVFYANHNSHGDFVLVWISLPQARRMNVRPVAGADYWLGGKIRRFIIENVFNGLTVPRSGKLLQQGLDDMSAALAKGESLIIFPEGTRNTGDEPLTPFKSGLYHLACAHPDAAFVPVWLNNISRVLPKGHYLPVPLLCQVSVGTPLYKSPDEDRNTFLRRAESALLDLSPGKQIPREDEKRTL